MFGASAAVMPQAKEYSFWMFIAALDNLPAQSMNSTARAESSVKITTIAVVTGAVLNIILDPIFMFEWGFNLGVAGASIATTISQFVTAIILFWFYLSKRSIIELNVKYVKPTVEFFKTVMVIGIPTAVVQICLALSTSLTNMSAARLPDSDLIIAAYGVVQRLVLVGHYVILGFMQGYQPVASYAYGAKNEERFIESEKFALKTTIYLTIGVAILYIVLAKPLIMLFNQNPQIVEYGSKLLISQLIVYPAFGFVYFLTITFQTIGESRFGIFLSTLRQGLLYVPLIMLLPSFFGVNGIYFSQPVADVITLVICFISYPHLKRIAKKNIS